MIKSNQKFGFGEIFSMRKLSKFKSSDTLFIMGSGPSICDMNSDQFNHISKHDSFGFTNWTLHDHVPTYYMNEFKFKDEEMIRCAEQELYNLVAKKKLYKDTALIFRAGSTEFKKINGINKLGLPFKNIFLALDVGVYGKNKDEFMKSLLFLKKCRILNSQFLLLQKSASLFRVIIFAYKLGYKKIVLCGIDLTGEQYFWEKEINKYSKKDLIIPILESNRTLSHKTNNPGKSTGGMIISDIIYATNETLLGPNSIELSVESEQSYFFPKYPIYDW